MARSQTAIWVSSVFAVVVLGTFYTHQWNGPVGTLQHYFIAIRNGDQGALERLAYNPGGDVWGPPAYAYALKIKMIPIFRNENMMEIKVLAYVPTSAGLRWWIAIWVVVKTPDGWRVHIPMTNAVN